MDEVKNELAFAYAMNLLEADEARAFEKQIAEDTQLASLVDKWQQTLTGLDNSVVPKKPPKAVWNNIKQEVWPTQKRGFASWFKPSYVAAFASLVIIALVSVFLLQNPHQAKFGNEWAVKADIKQGMLTLTALNPEPMPGNKVCNLWIKDKNDRLMKVGVLPMQDQKTMDLKLNKGLYDMFKEKATLMISIDDKDVDVTSPKTLMYEVAWL